MGIILIIISGFCFLLGNIFNKNYINYTEQELNLEEKIKETNNKEKFEELTEEKEKSYNLAYIYLGREKICYNLGFILLIIGIILFFL
ncbi:hypothetical protein BKN14_00250 [Candidatus Gracilibacteria bacterium HOT-871]|nr:hypothetical protein BKN14_00250 [Candidatus Gracilibacteria bacterium HOT-871]